MDELKTSITDSIDNMSDVSINIHDTDKQKEVNPEKKKRGRKSKSEIRDNNNKKAAAITAAHLTFTVGRIFAGESGNPSKELNEEENIIDAYDKYLESKNITDIPPGCALLLVLTGYMIRISKSQESKSKYRRMVDWFKKKVRRKGVIKNATQFDNRDDRERENYPSTANSKAVSAA